MPTRPPSPCPRCRRRLTSGGPCERCLPASRAEKDARRADVPWRAWYRSVAWREIRRVRLATDPLCVYCQEWGRVRAADVVDHIQPHRGDRALFFDYDNTQSLCASCHNGRKQREEQGEREPC